MSVEDKDVHTEHCCATHGCKYGDRDCPVENGRKKQSHPCESCDWEKEEVINRKPEQYTLSLITRMQDNGDGGYTTYLYNSEEEMLADHPLARNGKLSEELKDKILTEDDPYETGYIGSENFQVELVKGQLRLVKSASIHSGQ